jgi:hypothetical protein
MTKFDSLSDIQKEKFKSLSGFEHDGKSTAGSFSTTRPYDSDDWRLSPWYFSFKLDEKTGYLYCELDHRMTNNRTAGWDQAGNEISHDLVEKVYPSHF